MKNIRFLMLILVVGTLVLSACGAVATPGTSSARNGKVEAMPVAFVGLVDSIAGDQWVISGTTVTVDPAVVHDGPFNTGDQVKVEGVVNSDGSFTVSRVEVPAPQDASSLPPFGNDNSNEANANDNDVNANINDDNGNDANTNDDNGNGANSLDDNGANANDDNSNGGGGHSGGSDDNSGSGKGKGSSGKDDGGSGKGKGGGNDD